VVVPCSKIHSHSKVHLLSVPPRGLTLAYKVAELAPTLVSPTPPEPLVSTAGAAIFAVVKPTSELSIGP
jgi:hypothetical protein